MNLLQQIDSALLCIALSTILHYAWKNRKFIISELTLNPLVR